MTNINNPESIDNAPTNSRGVFDLDSILNEDEDEVTVDNSSEDDDSIAPLGDNADEDEESDGELSPLDEEIDDLESDSNEEDDEDAQTSLLPKLDQVIKDAIGDNAEATEAWNKHWKGIQKKERQLAQREESLTYDEQGYTVYRHYVDQFSSVETSKKAIKQLATALAKQFDVSVDEFIGEGMTGNQWESDGERLLAQQVEALKEELRKTKESALPDDVKQLVEEHKQSKLKNSQEAAKTAWLQKNSKTVISKVGKATSGWEVTQEMVQTALENDAKSLVKDPVLTLKRLFPDEYADFRAGVKPTNKKATNMPDLTRGGDKGYRTSNSFQDYSADDAWAEILAEGK